MTEFSSETTCAAQRDCMMVVDMSLGRRIAAGASIIMIVAVAFRAEVAIAQTYPERPVKIVAGQAPGGQTDIIARTVAQKLSEIWGQSVIVRNQTGAAGTIAAELVAKAPADGYTMLVGSQSNLAIAAALNPRLSYAPTRDFSPIGRVAYVRYALVVNAGVPAKTVTELVAYAKSHPGKLTFAAPGYSSLSRVAFEMFKHAASIDIVAVSYRESATALTDLVAGHIDMMIHDLGVVTPQVRAGKLHMMAILGAKRSSLVPEVPTFAEQGIPEITVDQWYGVVVPSGVPPAIVTKITNGLAQVLSSPDVQVRFEQLGYEPIVETPAQFADVIRSDTQAFATVIRRIGMNVDP
jgi:tripartite-type tricarboxylate transporter receptor subunit TctC